jgi:hypothetical protein
MITFVTAKNITLIYIHISNAVSVPIYSAEWQNVRKEELRRISEVRAIKVYNYLKTPRKPRIPLVPIICLTAPPHIDSDAGDKADSRNVVFCPA